MTGFETFFSSTKWWSNRLLILAFLMTAVSLHAQVRQTRRFEIPIFNRDKDYQIIPAGSHGLYVYQSAYTEKGEQLFLIKLDTAFQEKWSGYLPIERNYMLVGKKS